MTRQSALPGLSDGLISATPRPSLLTVSLPFISIFLPQLSLAATGPDIPGQSAVTIRLDEAVIGCVDPKATYVLTDKERVARHGTRWRSEIERRGRCVTIQAGETWQPLLSLGGLTLVRRTPPKAGLPPLYVRTSTLPGGADGLAATQSDDLDRLAVPAKPAAGSHGRMHRSSMPRGEVRVETLPPPARPFAPSPPAAVGPAPLAPPAGTPGTLSDNEDRADIITAAKRSYAVGFAIAILLAGVALAAIMASLLRFMLRWTNEPVEVEQEGIEPRLIPPLKLRQEPPELRLVHRSEPMQAVPPGTRVAPERLDAIEATAPQQCARLLRAAGWEASVRPSRGKPYADVVARRDGRVMALRCLPSNTQIDEQAVEEACVARERERADVAVILSNADFTQGARQLAARTGIDLLQADELPHFAA